MVVKNMNERKERANKIIQSAVQSNKDTVGKAAVELMAKSPETRSPIELEREMQKEYIDNLIECVNNSKKTYLGDFFITVLTKNEKLLPNVFRNYFYARSTCPSPNYDQTVFKYNSVDESIEYLWTLPNRETAHYLRKNALQVHPEERQLLDFILQFSDGTLFRLAKKLSGEEISSVLLSN
jgi:hypothetical protein